MTDLTPTEASFMAQAFSYAHEALAAKEVPVGCIFVYQSEIIAVGRNTVNQTRNAVRHAEVNCIDLVCDYCNKNGLEVQDVLSKTCVYVTVEPCIMCMNLMYDLKIERIIFGCKNDRFGGESVFDVRSCVNPVTIIQGGHRAEEAMTLLKEFYKGVNPSAPVTKVKLRGKKN